MKLKNILLILIVLISLQIFSEDFQEIRAVAEWEPALGTLITWPLGIPEELVIELSKDDKLFVLVGNNYEYEQALETFENWHINLSNCEFIFHQTNSHWTRDWGPVFVFDQNGEFTIIDPYFAGYPWVSGKKNRDWEQDDLSNRAIGSYFDLPVKELPAYFTGGNQMTDGYGNFFSTEQMYDENASIMSLEEFNEILESILGVNNMTFLSNIETYGIQHIDCGAKLLDEETVLIKKLPREHPDYEKMEIVAHEFAALTNCFGRPYKIHRINCLPYNSENECAAYTNSLILNKKVMVPLFGIEADNEAIQKYEELMPGYEIIGFQYENWYYYDALHCRTRGIFDPEMLYLRHNPFTDEIPNQDEYNFRVYIDDKSKTGLVSEETKIFYKNEDSETWESALLLETEEEKFFEVNISNLSAQAEIKYYVQAKNNRGVIETLPRSAPTAFFSFIIEANNEIDENFIENPNFKIYPNPLNVRNGKNLTIESTRSEEIQKVTIFNLKGQKVHDEVFSKNIEVSMKFNNKIETGVYFLKIKTENFESIKKILVR